MSFSITPGYSTQTSATTDAAIPANSAPAAPVETPKVQGASKDTVKLSQDAQIHSLKVQGQTASQIAASLGVSVAVVDASLNIATATTTSLTAILAK